MAADVLGCLFGGQKVELKEDREVVTLRQLHSYRSFIDCARFRLRYRHHDHQPMRSLNYGRPLWLQFLYCDCGCNNPVIKSTLQLN